MPFFREKQFKEVDALLKQGNKVEVIARISQWQVAYLALFQQQFPQHKEILRQNDFTTFWEECRKSLCLKGEPAFRFKTEARLNNADFVTGYLFYLLALRSQKNEEIEQYSEYLSQAIEFDSFHAKQRLLHDVVMDVGVPHEDYHARLIETIRILEVKVNLHGSPGYLVLAKAYLHMALQARHAADDQAISAAAFSVVCKYLYLASFAFDDSKDAIHNAYFGRGIEHSNSFHFATIDKMLEECLKLAGDSLLSSTQKSIKMQAQRDYNMLHEPIKAGHQLSQI